MSSTFKAQGSLLIVVIVALILVGGYIFVSSSKKTTDKRDSLQAEPQPTTSPFATPQPVHRPQAAPSIISITVDAAKEGKNIAKMKKGHNILPWHTNSPYAEQLYAKNIGYDLGLFNIYFWSDFYDSRNLQPLETRLKRLQQLGNPDIMITFMGIPREFSSAPNDDERARLPDLGCLPRYAGVSPSPTKYSEFKAYVKQWVDLARTYNVNYYQIWAEADLGIEEIINGKPVGCYWSGTEAEFLATYKVFTEAIREAYGGSVPGDVKIGGPGLFQYGGIIYKGSEPFAKVLPRFAKANNLPLDFFSWHQYAGNPLAFAKEVARALREELDKNGFTKSEFILSEYEVHNVPQNPDSRIWRSHRRAALLGGTFANIVQRGVDRQIMWMFDGISSKEDWGLFGIDSDLIVKPEFNLFKAINSMGDTMVSVDAQPTFIVDYVLASKSSDRISAIIINYQNARVSDIQLTIKNVPTGFTNYTKYIIDATHSNAYQIEERIKTRMEQGKVLARAQAKDTFAAALRQRGYAETFIQTALQNLEKYFVNPNDPEVTAWLNSLTPQQKQDVLDAFTQAMNTYNAILEPVANEINNWPEVKLYSETKTITILPDNTYSETLTLEPYAVHIIMLSQS